MKVDWQKEIDNVKAKLESGMTLEEVSNHYNVSKQRVYQVLKKFFPTITRKEYGSSKTKERRVLKRIEEIQHLFNRNTYFNLTDIEQAQSSFFTRKKQNCKYKKWDWDIVMSDLVWPSHCPILGIQLDWFAEKTKENSPSLDRLDSSKGYIKGNVAIMSWRANRIKNDGVAEEHHKIANYLDHIFL